MSDKKPLIHGIFTQTIARLEAKDKEIAALQQEVARLREENGVLRGELPGKLKGAEALADEKCKWFLIRAESAESSLLAMREALEAVIREADRDTPGFRTARAALSTTSAQAEEIKARWRNDAWNEVADWLVHTVILQHEDEKELEAVARSIRARAAQLTAKTGEGREG